MNNIKIIVGGGTIMKMKLLSICCLAFIVICISTACGSNNTEGNNNTETFEFSWMDDNGSGIALNAGENTDEWSVLDDTDASENCPICLATWDMDFDEPFDEFVKGCSHWDEFAAFGKNDTDTVLHIYQKNGKDGYRQLYDCIDGLDVQNEETNGCVCDYCKYNYNIGSNEYCCIYIYAHNESFQKYYLIQLAGIYETDADDYLNNIIDSIVIND